MTTFPEAYAAFARSNRANRADLWQLCVVSYYETNPSTPHRKSIRQLSEKIGFGIDKEDTIGDWCKVGWLIEYTKSAVIEVYENNMVAYDLRCLWDNGDALSYDHLLRMAKQAKRHELDPLEVLERLYNAMDGQKAESLERDIEEAHEDETVIGRRDLRTIRRRLQQNFGSVQFRKFISDRTARLAELLDKSVELDLKRLEAK